MARKKLGELLIEAGVLTEAQLRDALLEQRRWGGTIGRMLVEKRFISESDLVAVLARQFNVPVVDLDRTVIPRAVLELVPGDLAHELSVVPFAQPMKFLDVAMAEPNNAGVVDELRIRTQLNIRPHLAGPKALERALAKYYMRNFGPPRVGGDIGAVGVDTLISENAPNRRPTPLPEVRNSEIDSLQSRMARLEAMIARDEEVLRKLLGLLVAKGVATREEILEAIR
jgi:type IV pilus assembly protein PilB